MGDFFSGIGGFLSGIFRPELFGNIFKIDFFTIGFLEFSLIDTLLTLLATTLIGLFIFFTYRKSLKGVMYSHSFNMSLVMMTTVSSLIMMALRVNLGYSLGVIGALSIIRFRTAVKDPMDIVFIFWSIGSGIVAGVGLFPLAIICSLFISVTIIAIANIKAKNDPYLLIVNFSDHRLEEAIYDLMKYNSHKYRVKSKSIYPGGACELTVEVVLKNNDSGFLNEISVFDGVTNAVLVSYNGEYSI